MANARELTSPTLADQRARELVRELHSANRKTYWMDLLATAVVGWISFGLAVALRFGSIPMWVASAVAVCALYRGLCFMHELSHIQPKALPGFETAWNFLMGVPLLIPSFVYVGVHQWHHKLSTYGTSQDPEYLPFAQSSRMTIGFIAHSVLIPSFLLLRFILVTPVGWFSTRFQRVLVQQASSLTMNLAYRREASGPLMRKVMNWSLITWAAWASALGLAAAGFIPWRFFGVWYLVVAAVSLVNTLRTLVAHEYESVGEPLSREEQLLDSINVPGAPWTGLWAPVGLRYHALHHLFPGIPYHNLAEAHRRLALQLPGSDSYQTVTSSGMLASLRTLLTKGMGRA